MSAYDHRGLRVLQFILFLLLFGLIALSVIFELDWVSAFDRAIQTPVFALRSDALTAILTPLTYSGNSKSVVAICAVLVILPKTRRWFGLPMAASGLVSVALHQGLKALIRRPRPDIALHLVEQGGFSFPSGHTLSCLMVWGTFLLLVLHYSRTAYRRPLQSQQVGPAARFTRGTLQRPGIPEGLSTFLVILTAIYIVLMGLSRIYVGVHWPTDVLASWCLGLAMMVPTAALVKKL